MVLEKRLPIGKDAPAVISGRGSVSSKVGMVLSMAGRVESIDGGEVVAYTAAEGTPGACGEFTADECPGERGVPAVPAASVVASPVEC